MAATKTEQSTKLIVKVQTGLTASGEPKFSQRNFASINAAATDDSLLSAGNALGALQEYPVGAVMRQDVCTLSEA
ncbi:DUF1659 domain-containing protein [Pectinatus brassicae]|uniref:DUF1659 domain-containing protein n=1 Tax=Pectinatus brassicae TaxID=862415 RepID=A0A840UGC0_9FIRM|nr:DUF1659 domain-containing protein [Pectinatus brassicae]MBB5336801.1 hypothetical protein [Pectinatus brassicae]